MIDTNAPELSQNCHDFNLTKQTELIQQIKDWFRQVPDTMYEIIIVKHRFTGAVNIFTLKERYQMRSQSKSLLRIPGEDVDEKQIDHFIRRLRQEVPELVISKEF